MTQQVPHLGYPVTDVVTGFSGVVVGHAVYLSGCSQSLVVPKVAGDGTFREGQWFDDQRLKLSEGEPVQLQNGDTPGADRKPSRSY